VLLGHPTAGDADVAVVFVHGFLGGARSTWIDFHNLVDDLPAHERLWSKCNLFFFDYESRDQIAPLTESLRAFLRRGAFDYIYQSVLPSSMKLWAWYTTSLYKQLILVGHSTGAVIIRDLIVQILKTHDIKGSLKSWVLHEQSTRELEILLPQASLCFFAPAHLGAMEAGKLGVAKSVPLLDRLLWAYMRSNPLYWNLRPGSPTLLNLQRETESLYSKYPAVPALKASMLFGQHEEIVELGGYLHDEYYGVEPGEKRTEPGHNHTSICKPSPTFTTPLEFVAEALRVARAVR
jgi:hypothetical protein